MKNIRAKLKSKILNKHLTNIIMEKKMLVKLFKSLISIFALSLLLTGMSFSQEKNDTQSSHKMEMHSKMKTDYDQINKSDTPVAYKDTIDLKAIDINKDGMVYEDMMDYNVLSDAPGTCPLCGMTLKGVTLEKAKYNLVKNGFKVK